MTIKDLLFINAECELENLIETPFGICDISDGTIHVGNNVWRDMRDNEARYVDAKIYSEEHISHATSSKYTDDNNIDDTDGHYGEDIHKYKNVYEDVYTNGLNIGFKL